ncbi:MAG: Lsr2 family protein [Microbacterium enclense]
MAIRRVTQLVDDLDGTVLDTGEGKQITFCVEGRAYEIDLSEENADTFYKALAPFVNVARSAGSAAAPRTGRRATRVKSDVDLGAVRQWARENGHTVSDRGRVPVSIVEKYKAETA